MSTRYNDVHTATATVCPVVAAGTPPGRIGVRAIEAADGCSSPAVLLSDEFLAVVSRPEVQGA